MKSVIAAAASLCAIVAPASSWAWGSEGHQIAAAIAQQHLTPAAQSGIRSLLGSAHIYDEDVSSWADAIRVSRKETAAWHFADIPIQSNAFEPQRDCEAGACAVDKIEDFRLALADSTTSRELRVEALKFLVHFVGDLHQPLHCEDNNDRGGNQVAIRYPGEQRIANLHKVWDSLVLEGDMGDRDVAAYAEALDATITRAQIQEWARTNNPEVWANEVHKVSQQVYRELPPADTGGTRTLPPGYGNTYKATIELQLQRAGIRLAMLLNSAFGAGPTDPVPLNAPERRQALRPRALRQ